MELTREEARILGSLVEKELATPQLYPLTENALIAACNQTTNRDPVVAYDISTVRITVRGLREKGLLRMVHRSGERSDKHQQLLDRSLGLSSGPVSLLAVLLLRGPQTLAELRARSERMHPFDSLAQLHEALAELTDRDDPLVARLERQPGHKEARYGQLLVDGDQASLEDPTGPQQAQARALLAPARTSSEHGALPSGDAPYARSRPEDPTLGALAREVELLRAEVATLRTQVERLREGT